MLLLFAQIGFLACNQLCLTTRFVRTTCLLCLINDWRRRCRSFRRRCFLDRHFVTLDEGTLLSDFNLNRARFASGVRLLDLGRFLARQRDFLLFAVSYRAVRTAQVIEELVLVFFRQRIGRRTLDDASITQLRQQQVRRHP